MERERGTALTRRALATLVVLAITTATVAGIAVATPGSGVIAAPILSRGAMKDAVTMKLKWRTAHGIDVANLGNPSDVVIQHVVLGPSGHTGWHTHPGPVFVMVEAGDFILYDSKCGQRTYTTGDIAFDPGRGHAHIGRNPSTISNTELYVVYFDVPSGSGPRIDLPVAPATCF